MITDYLPLVIFVIGFCLLVKWERDKLIARKAFDQAFRDGLSAGFEKSQELWRVDLQQQADRAFAEITEAYPTVVKVVENRALAQKEKFDANTVELPRVSMLVIVDPKTVGMPKIGELKTRWEKML